MRAGMLAGTAYVAHRSGQRSTERGYAEAEQDQRLENLEARGAAPPPPAPAAAPAAGGSDLVSELSKLKGLLDSGALTQEEFDAAKAKLLAA